MENWRQKIGFEEDKAVESGSLILSVRKSVPAAPSEMEESSKMESNQEPVGFTMANAAFQVHMKNRTLVPQVEKLGIVKKRSSMQASSRNQNSVFTERRRTQAHVLRPVRSSYALKPLETDEVENLLNNVDISNEQPTLH